MKRREIMRRDVVKYVAIRRSFSFEKTLFDELYDGLCNFRRPLSNAGIEQPPMKDAVDGVLCIRMPGQVVENFWRRRWKRGVGEHALGRQSFPCSNRRTSKFPLLCANMNCAAPPLARVSIPPLKMGLGETISVARAHNGCTTAVESQRRTIISDRHGKYSGRIRAKSLRGRQK